MRGKKPLIELNNIYITILESPRIKASEIATNLTKGFSTIERYIKLIKVAGYIHYKGSLKTGGYYFIEN